MIDPMDLKNYIANVKENCLPTKQIFMEYSEFYINAIDEKYLQRVERLALTFKFFDEDSSNSISHEEIMKCLDFDKSLNSDLAINMI